MTPLLCLALAVPAGVTAAHGRGGARPHAGARPHFHHHFHPGPVIGFGLIGPPAFFYPDYPSYYFRPAQPPAPTVYIEQFPGVPSPGMSNIVCPSSNMAPYPEVTQCPGGWSRIVSSPRAG